MVKYISICLLLLFSTIASADICPKCGKCHNCGYSSGARTQHKSSYQQPRHQQANNALAIVNQKRRQMGLYPLQYDANLTAVAQRKSNYRASRRMSGHDNSNMGGARNEGVGYSSNGANGFTTCFLYSRSHRTAGAAIDYDRYGRAYYTLLLR